MSTHTMPPLSLLAADFVKSFLKTADSAAKINEEQDEKNAEKAEKPIYHRRKILNGGTGFMNGHGRRSDVDDDNEDDSDDEMTEIATKKETKLATAADGDTEMQEEEVALKKRKRLIVKNEEITAKTSAARKQNDIEAQLKRIAEANLEIDF